MRLLPKERILVMPKSRQRFSTWNGPPGSSPGGPTPIVHRNIGHAVTDLNMVNRLYEKHLTTFISTIIRGNTLTLSARTSFFRSNRLTCPIGAHERPDVMPIIYESRTRLPANQLHQTRDLKHGCQGSISIYNPIMEE
jgi:hypothetical protein